MATANFGFSHRAAVLMKPLSSVAKYFGSALATDSKPGDTRLMIPTAHKMTVALTEQPNLPNPCRFSFIVRHPLADHEPASGAARHAENTPKKLTRRYKNSRAIRHNRVRAFRNRLVRQ